MTKLPEDANATPELFFTVKLERNVAGISTNRTALRTLAVVDIDISYPVDPLISWIVGVPVGDMAPNLTSTVA